VIVRYIVLLDPFCNVIRLFVLDVPWKLAPMLRIPWQRRAPALFPTLRKIRISIVRMRKFLENE
jgi:hypothetical protein